MYTGTRRTNACWLILKFVPAYLIFEAARIATLEGSCAVPENKCGVLTTVL